MSERWTVTWDDNDDDWVIRDMGGYTTPHDAVKDLNRLASQVATMREACEAAIPWVVLMTSDYDKHRHPTSIENAKAALRQLMTVLDYPADRIAAFK